MSKTSVSEWHKWFRELTCQNHKDKDTIHFEFIPQGCQPSLLCGNIKAVT